MISDKRQTALDPERLFWDAERDEEKGDHKTAFKRLLAAAHLGHAMSQVSLGNFYASGRAVRRSLRDAAHWYKKAYRNGYSDGALNLAIDRRNAGNRRSAAVWFKKAIAMNNGDAYVELARMYSSRKSGRIAAADLLRRALRLRRDQISEAAKEEAQSMLRSMSEE